MSGESFFSIDHTPQQQPTHKGDATQESKPQGDENRSGIMSYDDLVAKRRANEIASALAGVSAALNEYNGTTRDENKGKTVSPEAIYRENILYPARVTRLVLEMRKYVLATRGSNRAEDYLTGEAEEAADVLGYGNPRTLNGGFDPSKWNDAINGSDEGSDDNARSEPTSPYSERQNYPSNGNGDSSNVVDISQYAAGRARRSAATATAPSPHNGYYSGGRAA